VDDLLKSSGGHMFDADGFLLAPEVWSEALAIQIAKADGMNELSRLQIDLLHTLRNEFKKTGQAGMPAGFFIPARKVLG